MNEATYMKLKRNAEFYFRRYRITDERKKRKYLIGLVTHHLSKENYRKEL